MWRPISAQVTFDRRQPSAAKVIEAIRQLHLQELLHRLLANFPLPERREKLGAGS